MAVRDGMPQRQSSRTSRRAQAPTGEVEIPDKLYFRIDEVSRLTETKKYVLRYWEREFPTLKPVKSDTGRRLYRRRDLESVFEIKRLLYEKGFTIDGARRELASMAAHDRNGTAETSPPQKPQPAAAQDGQHLRAIQCELQAILTILSSKC